MQLIGFNFSKISTEKKSDLGPAPTINTNIEFTDVAKDEVALLKDAEVLRIGFRFSITYHTAAPKKDKDKETKEKEAQAKDAQGSLLFEGTLLFATDKEKVKELLKHWKKHELPAETKIPLFNLILRRCSTKALDLEEQLGLPPHIPLPQLKPKQQ